MRILAIETSCDETGISVLDASSSATQFNILSDKLSSQAELHTEYGGVYPTLAKREHIKSLPILLEEVKNDVSLDSIDYIAVTNGPGLEPALWTGITFAQDFANELSIPLIPVNHMEGHIYSALIDNTDENKFTLIKPEYPTVALLISGGHTDLVLIEKEMTYKYIGGTLDDAVGEAFDKVSRMLGLGYPGGPIISKLAQDARNLHDSADIAITESKQSDKLTLDKPLPRPMLNSDNYDFSFSGLKTAVLYQVREFQKTHSQLSNEFKLAMSAEFEDAVAEVLAHKTDKAIKDYQAKSLIIGGGVAANNFIHNSIANKLTDKITIYKPKISLSGDNALMIAIAGAKRAMLKQYTTDYDSISAYGKLKL